MKSWIRPNICLMTAPTLELINLFYQKIKIDNVKILDFHKPFKYDNYKVEFLPADHVLGSSQVLVSIDGYHILYSSDFLLTPKTEIPSNIDILIIDATYGSKSNIRPPQELIYETIFNLINDTLKKNLPIYIFTHQGKIQETMDLLFNEMSIHLPFLLSNNSLKLAKIYEKFGRNIGEYFSFDSDQGAEILKSKNFIGFVDSSNILLEKQFILKNSFKIDLSGWIFKKPSIKIGKNHYSIAMSAHADFNDLMKYIEIIQPKFVITDNFRFGSAQEFCKEIEKNLHIQSIALPIKSVSK
ncbi:MAG: hypothetical protein ACTSYZ_09675 [Candidatus Helarchaeota archaeon]